jgi:hypothetical protein
MPKSSNVNGKMPDEPSGFYSFSSTASIQEISKILDDIACSVHSVYSARWLRRFMSIVPVVI